jgi:hypothetical protein
MARLTDFHRQHRAGEEIVARDRGPYPKKLGKWKDLSRTVTKSFGIPIRFD